MLQMYIKFNKLKSMGILITASSEKCSNTSNQLGINLRINSMMNTYRKRGFQEKVETPFLHVLLASQASAVTYRKPAYLPSLNQARKQSPW